MSLALLSLVATIRALISLYWCIAAATGADGGTVDAGAAVVLAAAAAECAVSTVTATRNTTSPHPAITASVGSNYWYEDTTQHSNTVLVSYKLSASLCTLMQLL
jgi:hypothetical protein